MDYILNQIFEMENKTYAYWTEKIKNKIKWNEKKLTLILKTDFNIK